MALATTLESSFNMFKGNLKLNLRFFLGQRTRNCIRHDLTEVNQNACDNDRIFHIKMLIPVYQIKI